jgi:hypothetical protein
MPSLLTSSTVALRISATSGILRSSAFWQSSFHPDYAPGEGIEKIVRNEIFKEIWNEVERLDQGVLATRSATGQPSSVV